MADFVMPDVSGASQIAEVPFHGRVIQSVQCDGKPYVVFRPLVESLGLDADSQMKRLRRHSWAGTVIMTVPSKGGPQKTTCVDLRTLTMWLATIDENRVAAEARPLVVAYQREVADVIEAYWRDGGVVNPRASEHQRKALMYELRAQMELAQAAKGLIHEDFLEAKARIILARGMGEHPELDPGTRPLYVQSFLKEKGLSKKQLSARSGSFGKRLKSVWTQVHGVPPKKAPVELPNGRVIDVYAYTEADRPLMERVWGELQAASG